MDGKNLVFPALYGLMLKLRFEATVGVLGLKASSDKGQKSTRDYSNNAYHSSYDGYPCSFQSFTYTKPSYSIPAYHKTS